MNDSAGWAGMEAAAVRAKIMPKPGLEEEALLRALVVCSMEQCKLRCVLSHLMGVVLSHLCVQGGVSESSIVFSQTAGEDGGPALVFR